MNYEEALAALTSMTNRGWKLGLERMQEFVKRADLTDAVGANGGPQFIHIAGTNGKGSVTAFTQSILVEAGHRTGAFFSPFVVDPRERVQFGRELIGKDEFTDLFVRYAAIGESLDDTPFGAISEFELKTGIGFGYWKQKQCDWVALEVGLGGRLDSTNVVTPRACAVVSIGLDHCHILGHTYAEIAREKAGIIKPGIPVVVGQMPPEALSTIEEIAIERDAPIWRVGNEISVEALDQGFRIRTPRSEATVHPSLIGQIQGHNAAVAYAACELSGAVTDPETLARGISLAAAPGRYQEMRAFGRDFILDGAHNADAGRVLAQSLAARLDDRPVVLVTGMVGGHDVAEFYRSIQNYLETVHLAPIDSPRANAPSEIARILAETANVQAEIHDSVESALRQAALNCPPNGVVLVTGSFYLVGEAILTLQNSVHEIAPY
ncbi:MAG: bifunctional folylpolyglutamate synthase/dihydrofolate synthase [Fimbriimonas sp.]